MFGQSGEQKLESAVDAYNSGDYESAIAELRKAAKYGSPVAQHQLAYMHREGLGTAQSDELAFKWYEQAAKQGHVKSQTVVGEL